MSDAVLREENNTRASIYLQYNVRDAEKSFGAYALSGVGLSLMEPLDAVSRPRTESQSRISLASQDGSDMFDPNFDTESEFLGTSSTWPQQFPSSPQPPPISSIWHPNHMLNIRLSISRVGLALPRSTLGGGQFR